MDTAQVKQLAQQLGQQIDQAGQQPQAQAALFGGGALPPWLGTAFQLVQTIFQLLQSQAGQSQGQAQRQAGQHPQQGAAPGH
jgi:hypothetical protein